MDNNYYEQILKEIDEKINAGKLKEANHLLQNELNMPYIPLDVESSLKERLVDVRAQCNSQPLRLLSSEEILSYLDQDLEMQLEAVQALNHYNCRPFLEQIQQYFDRKPHSNLQALLIDTLIDQEISEELTVHHCGQMITFIPRYVEKAEMTDGFVMAKQFLETWFESNNPSFLQLCIQVLIQEAFLMLPLSYEENEAEILAMSVVNFVSKSMDDGKIFKRLKHDLKIKDCFIFMLNVNNN